MTDNNKEENDKHRKAIYALAKAVATGGIWPAGANAPLGASKVINDALRQELLNFFTEMKDLVGKDEQATFKQAIEALTTP